MVCCIRDVSLTTKILFMVFSLSDSATGSSWSTEFTTIILPHNFDCISRLLPNSHHLRPHQLYFFISSNLRLLWPGVYLSQLFLAFHFHDSTWPLVGIEDVEADYLSWTEAFSSRRATLHSNSVLSLHSFVRSCCSFNWSSISADRTLMGFKMGFHVLFWSLMAGFVSPISTALVVEQILIVPISLV